MQVYLLLRLRVSPAFIVYSGVCVCVCVKLKRVYTCVHVPWTGKLGELHAALQSFERSLELAKLVEDEDSQAAIKKALEEINSRIVEEIKPNEDTPSD